MAEKITQHKHCQICGKAIPVSEEFCNKECQEKMQDIVKRKRMWMYVFYALMGLFIAMMLFGGL